MIELIGWISTAAILLGAYFNARGKSALAMYIWIVGDLGWITYDMYIHNFSHLTLSGVIILLNCYGIYRLWKS